MRAASGQQGIRPVLVMLLTGLAFVVGGFFRTWLEWLLGLEGESSTGLQTGLCIWAGFVGEAALGMAVLAGLLRKSYPFRKLWLTGLGAFALGVLIPALLLSQFFYAAIVFPGLFVGVAWRVLLKAAPGSKRLMLLITAAFMLCQVLVFAVPNSAPWAVWLYEHCGNYSVTVLAHIVQDLIIGVFTAYGVMVMVRVQRERQERRRDEDIPPYE